MEKKQKSFVQGAALLGAAGLMVKIIGAIFRIPFANAVGPEGACYYDAAYPYYSFLLVISSSGLPTAISKQVSERVALGDHAGAKEVLGVSVKLLSIIGIITSVAMFLGANVFAAITSYPETVLSFRALAPALLFVSVMCAYRGYLQGMQQMAGTALSQIAEQLGKLVIGLTLAIKLLPKGPEYAAMGALIGVSASELMGLIVVYLFYRRRKGELDRLAKHSASKPRGFGTVSKALLAIAIPITIGASISPLTGMVDSALIGRMLTKLGYSEEVTKTAYSLLRTYVTTLINMPGVLTMALAMSLVPAISAKNATALCAGAADYTHALSKAYRGGIGTCHGPYAHGEHGRYIPFHGAVHDRRCSGTGQAADSGFQSVHRLCAQGHNNAYTYEHTVRKHPGRGDINRGMLCIRRRCGHDLHDAPHQMPR